MQACVVHIFIFSVCKMDDEHFIEVVKKYPCLWNTLLSTYKCTDVKDAAWEEIVKVTHTPDIKTAKSKWKRLRDGHRDALKRKNATRSGQATKQTREWKYEKILEFLLPYMTNRERSTNFNSSSYHSSPTMQQSNEDENSHSSSRSIQQHSDSDPSTPQVNSPQRSEISSITSASQTNKRKSNDITDLLQLNQENREKLQREREELKTMILSKNNEESLDDMDHFFLSMARNLKKRSPYLQLQTKRKIVNIVLEAEEFEIQNTWYQNYGYSSVPSTSNNDISAATGINSVFESGFTLAPSTSAQGKNDISAALDQNSTSEGGYTSTTQEN